MLLFLLLPVLVSSVSLRVMTFNIWLSGEQVENGLLKIAKHIVLVNPDVVALQEVQSKEHLGNLTLMLGPEWTGLCDFNASYPDVAILTRHAMHLHSMARTNWTFGVKISLISGQVFNFWAAHLDYKAYGPYAANNKMVTKMEQIMAGEHPQRRAGRYQNAIEVQNNEKMQQWISKSNIVPVIFAGDFNCPSHLDWTDATRDMHGGWTFEWPATKILEEMGFRDSFRELYPDPVKDPGYTWSTVNKFNAEWDYAIPEPQDRIDFILYQGNTRPTASFTYSGSEPLTPIPDQWHNDYPSDHFAVITEFDLGY